MKLRDLRQRLREAKDTRPAVDQLDEFLISKGSMAPLDNAPPVHFNSRITGRKADILVIDDPLAPGGKRKELVPPDPFPMWAPTEVDASKPPTLETMLRAGNYELKPGDGRPGGRLAGKLFYEPREDDLCMVKELLDPSRGEVSVWFGKRDSKRQEILIRLKVWQLYVVETTSCKRCFVDRRGIALGKCMYCNTLGAVPTRKAFQPWAAERLERRDHGEDR